MSRLYKHICGYPIKEEDILGHCPGCSGRILPDELKPISEELPFLGEGAEDCMRVFVTWLQDTHPDLAAQLTEAVTLGLADTEISAELRKCLSKLQPVLIA